MSFFPKLVGLFLIMPLAVAGAALLGNSSFMILAGIKIMNSRPVDLRVIYTFGIAIIAGVSRMVYADYFSKLTGIWSILTSSSLTITTLTALVLTLIFRLGIHKKIKINNYELRSSSKNFASYLDEQLKLWDLPSVTLDRAKSSGQSLIALLSEHEINHNTVTVHLDYDQVKLTLEIYYQGDPIYIESAKSLPKYLIEEEAFEIGLKSMLDGVFPDQYYIQTKNKDNKLTMIFFN